jgi:hypothetical protein
MLAALGVAAACGSTTPTTEQPTVDASSSTTTTATPPASSTASTPPTSSAPAGSSSASNPPSGELKVWADAKSIGDQAKFMGQTIVPHMKPVFQAFDAKRYEKFGCQTCHGPQNKPPKEFLPKLSLKGGTFAVTKDKAAMLDFMMTKVSSEMADAMGEKHFDPTTKTGFGCGNCHVIDM